MRKSIVWSVIVLGYVLLVWGGQYVASASMMVGVQAILQENLPRLLYVNLVLIVLALLFNFRFAFRWRGRLPRAAALILVIIVAGGVLLTVFVAPATHRIFYDEDIYQDIALNMAYTNRAQMCNDGSWEYGIFQCLRGEYNKQPYGFPFLLSIVFRLAGVNEQVAFYYNNFLLGASMVTVFFIALHLFRSFSAGFFSALIMALIPQNAHWFNTVSAEPSAAVFSAMSVLAALHAARNKDNASLFLFVSLTAFCLHMRPENSLILLVLPLIFLLKWPRSFLEPRFYLFMWFFGCIAAPAFLHALVVRQNPWGSSSAPFAVKYFTDNFAVNINYYFNNGNFPVLFTVLALAGLLNLGMLREQLLLWVWFFLFFGVFLFFYAGRYDYGADIRFAVTSHLPLALLAGGSVHGLGKKIVSWSWLTKQKWHSIVTVIIFLTYIPFLPKVRAVGGEAWAARADHVFAKKMADKLPEESVILTHNPGMFHIWGKNAAQASLPSENSGQALQQFFDRFKGGVYFHFNFWCNVDDPLQNSFCTKLIEHQPHELVAEYRELTYRYAIYRLLPRKK